MSNKNRGVNPVTYVGYIPGAEPNPEVEALRAKGQSPHQFPTRKFEGIRSASFGRLWLSSHAVEDGSHQHTPGAETTWDRTMQFVIWEKADAPIAFMIGNETEFIRSFKQFKNKQTDEIVLTGTDRRDALAATRSLSIKRKDADTMEMSLSNDDGIMSVVEIGIESWYGGLKLLFPNHELVIPEQN
jgi:hypothetical protein